jgi:cytochrome c-type biogenesis protein CcmH/NrfG
MAGAVSQSREQLLQELEQATGRSFHTHEDVRQFIAEIEVEKAAKHARSTRGWRAVKSTALLALLILAFVQYYIADSLLQTVSLPQMTFFLSVSDRG